MFTTPDLMIGAAVVGTMYMMKKIWERTEEETYRHTLLPVIETMGYEEQPDAPVQQEPMTGTISYKPQGNMAGYNRTPSSYVQTNGGGYDNPALQRARPGFPRFRSPRSFVPNYTEKFRKRLQVPGTDRADQDMELLHMMSY